MDFPYCSICKNDVSGRIRKMIWIPCDLRIFSVFFALIEYYFPFSGPDTFSGIFDFNNFTTCFVGPVGGNEADLKTQGIPIAIKHFHYFKRFGKLDIAVYHVTILKNQPPQIKDTFFQPYEIKKKRSGPRPERLITDEAIKS